MCVWDGTRWEMEENHSHLRVSQRNLEGLLKGRSPGPTQRLGFSEQEDLLMLLFRDHTDSFADEEL